MIGPDWGYSTLKHYEAKYCSIYYANVAQASRQKCLKPLTEDVIVLELPGQRRHWHVW